MKELNPKQQRFVEEYCIDHNGTRAAIAAGYSANSAAVQAVQLKSMPHVKAAIADREAHAADVLGMTQIWVLEQLKRVLTQAVEERDRPNALRAMDMHMKHRGMYAPVQVETTNTIFTLDTGRELENSSESAELSAGQVELESTNSDLTGDYIEVEMADGDDNVG